ncbi:Hypothetical predicted protein [Mytilus galloprovincialis]|uniref:Uncharacterized protein n=2 Tax=Mytilus galloprovincialis TaxID=29158 RepID=A0A8B6CJH2_MYTGA|nr:Hypothetical predicted protein [Mytilus galloprovincialis]
MHIWKKKKHKKTSSKNKTKQNSTLKVNKDFGKKPTHQHRKIVSKSKRNGKNTAAQEKILIKQRQQRNRNKVNAYVN